MSTNVAYVAQFISENVTKKQTKDKIQELENVTKKQTIDKIQELKAENEELKRKKLKFEAVPLQSRNSRSETTNSIPAVSSTDNYNS
ncbi:unnamed protein product [Parnassius apollo]|uniref:(apollo) hypothetical protein n=1 Tax=Parnassius apollo TaxID=110799 RepID=A0A8S3Y8E8_PARAO|nr:unnamed protein product [Parnassius apollo]